MTLSTEEIDRVQGAREPVEHNDFAIVGHGVERIEDRAVGTLGQPLKAEFITEAVSGIGGRPERLHPVHADVEDRLVCALQPHVAKTRVGEPLAFIERHMLTQGGQIGGSCNERGNGGRDHREEIGTQRR